MCVCANAPRWRNGKTKKMCNRKIERARKGFKWLWPAVNRRVLLPRLIILAGSSPPMRRVVWCVCTHVMFKLCCEAIVGSSHSYSGKSYDENMYIFDSILGPAIFVIYDPGRPADTRLPARISPGKWRCTRCRSRHRCRRRWRPFPLGVRSGAPAKRRWRWMV